MFIHMTEHQIFKENHFFWVGGALESPLSLVLPTAFNLTWFCVTLSSQFFPSDCFNLFISPWKNGCTYTLSETQSRARTLHLSSKPQVVFIMPENSKNYKERIYLFVWLLLFKIYFRSHFCKSLGWSKIVTITITVWIAYPPLCGKFVVRIKWDKAI